MAYEAIAEGGGTLTQGFGCTDFQREWGCSGCPPGKKFHAGIDIGIRTGTPLKALGYGQVVSVGDNSTCGGPRRGLSGCFGPGAICVRSGGYDFWYGHCSAPLVVCGQLVVPGQRVAYSGTLGCSTGPHLHYEVQRAGVINGCQALNPKAYLTSWPGAAPDPAPAPDPTPSSIAPLLLAAGGAALIYAADNGL